MTPASESFIFIDDDDEVRRANAQSLELAGLEVQAFGRGSKSAISR